MSEERSYVDSGLDAVALTPPLEELVLCGMFISGSLVIVGSLVTLFRTLPKYDPANPFDEAAPARAYNPLARYERLEAWDKSRGEFDALAARAGGPPAGDYPPDTPSPYHDLYAPLPPESSVRRDASLSDAECLYYGQSPHAMSMAPDDADTQRLLAYYPPTLRDVEPPSTCRDSEMSTARGAWR